MTTAICDVYLVIWFASAARNGYGAFIAALVRDPHAAGGFGQEIHRVRRATRDLVRDAAMRWARANNVVITHDDEVQ